MAKGTGLLDIASSYSNIWNDVNREVVYLPSKNRYSRLAMIGVKVGFVSLLCCSSQSYTRLSIS